MIPRACPASTGSVNIAVLNTLSHGPGGYMVPKQYAGVLGAWNLETAVRRDPVVLKAIWGQGGPW